MKLESILTRKTLTSAIALAMTASAAVHAAEKNRLAELEEVVVTASRVQTSAQDTAISLTAYTGNSLLESGISNVQALQTIDPSLNVVSSDGAGYVALRGIASTDTTEIGDPSVPIARDGFFTNRSFSIQASMYDIERVEVLKGPQGTLFGRNSTGGLVSIITKKPSKEMEGYISVEAGSYSAKNLEGAINIPISDRVQVRLSGISRKHDGYRDLPLINDKGDDENSQSGRIQVAIQPTDNLDILLSHQRDSIDHVGDLSLNGPIGQEIDFGDADSYEQVQPTFTDLNGERTRWEFNYNIAGSDWVMTYASGYDKQNWNHALDGTPPSRFPTQQFLQAEQPRTHNHEIRVATPQDQPLTAQFGYFYFSEKNALDSGLFETSGPYVNRYLIKFDYNIETESKAYFGQIGYQINDEYKVTLGARNTSDTKARTGQAVLDLEVATFGFLPFAITTPGNGDIDQSKLTYHIGLDYTPTEDNLFYAKYSTGYKSGGFNSNGSAPSVDYGPENLKAFELGTKNNLMANRLELNASLFYQDFTGYQATQTTPVVSSGSGVFNVGSATIYGLESELTALVSERGKVNINATWLNASFDDLDQLIRAGDDMDYDISNNTLPNAPDFVVTASYEHSFDVGENGLITAKVDGKYSSSLYYTVFNTADTEQESYVTGNVSLSYEPLDADWKIQAFVRNVTDEVILARAQRNYVGEQNNYQFQPPRTMGIRGIYNF